MRDDLTEVRELRADAPTPDRARLAAGRTRLIEAAGARAARRAPWAGRRFVIAGVVAAVTAVAVLASVLVDGSDAGRKVSPAASPSAGLKGIGAKELLERAARVVEKEPDDAVPRADQWIYTKSVQEGENTLAHREQRSLYTTEHWIRYDGSAVADRMPYEGAKLTVRTMHLENGGEGDDRSPREMHRFLSTLPADGKGTLAAIREAHAIGDVEGETRPQRDYREISVLLDADVMPSRGLAGLYRALASLPGGTVTDHLVTNAAGRRVIAVGFDREFDPKTNRRMADEWLLDPQTYRIVGMRMVEGDKVVGGGSTVADAVVDEAGRRG